MATKKLAEDLEEIKKSLNFMSDEITKVVKQQTDLMGIMEEIKELRELVTLRDKKIEQLEQRIDDLEQQARSKDLIVTGLKTKHRNYARATAGLNEGEDAPPEELQTLEQQLLQFLSNKNIHLDEQDISSCYTLPNKEDKTKPHIVVQLITSKRKIDILRQTRKLKDTGVYINEHLTKKNGEIARASRILKKKSKIQTTWTRNGKVYIKPNGSEQNKSILIKNLGELDQYK